MFESHQPNLENMQQYLKQESEKSEGSGVYWWSIPTGMSSVRILPPWDPTGRVALPVYMHPIEFKGEGMSFTKYNWTCVGKTFDKSCPICEGLNQLAASGVDIQKWEANRRQFYFNAIVMYDPTYDEAKGTGTAPGTHVLMKAPKTIYDWVITQITNPMVGDITSITNGIDVYITRAGSGLGTTYTPTFSPDGRKPIPQEYLDKITELYNIDEVFSTGFDQKQIDDLVNHLKKSAGVISNSIPSMQQQMAGYTQVPTPQYQQVPNQYTSFNTPTPPNPFGESQSAVNFQQTAYTQTSPMTTSPSDMQSVNTGDTNLPKCFGQYDPGSVNCVVCPKELDCSKSK